MNSEDQSLINERRGYLKIHTFGKRYCRYVFVDMFNNPVCKEVFEMTPIIVRKEQTLVTTDNKVMLKILKVHSRDEQTLLENLERIRRKAKFRFGQEYENACDVFYKSMGLADT